MKKQRRKILAIIIIFAMVLSMGFDAIKVFATDVTYEDTIKVEKSAMSADGEDCRTFEVELKITGVPPAKPVDVVLVIDRSGSMSGNRMTAAKAAAKTFADKVFANGNPNGNRIAVVSYSTTATTNLAWSSSLADVKSAINTMSASGYTNIQGGFIKAEDQINNARAGANKAIVLLSDGEANRRDSYPPRPFGGSHNQYTAAAYQKGEDLQSKAKVFTIGLGVGTSGLAVDTLVKAAHPGSYYSAPDSTDLATIYNSISAQLNYSATNAVVTDVIGDDFDFVPNSFIENPVGTPAASISGDGRTITWSPGTITTEATLKYQVKLKGTVAGGNDIPTNESAILTYTDVNGNSAEPKEFNIPTVDVEISTISLEIKKEVFDLDEETPLPDDDTTFYFTVVGPTGSDSQSRNVTVKQEESATLNNLPAGEYVITELDSAGYEVIGSTSQTINLEFKCDSPTEEIIFKNARNANNGSIEIEKILLDTHGEPINVGKAFKIKLTGPSYPLGEEFTISNSQPKVINNLTAGEYTIEELNSDYFFEVTINPSPIQVANNQQTKVTITNKEKKIGELTVKKVLLDEDGEEILNDPREFRINITGPSNYNKTITLKGGESIKLTGLEYGDYTATEVNEQGYEQIDNYIVSTTGVANLSYASDFRFGSITLTNREKPEVIHEGDIEIEKKVEFGERELGKLGRLRDLLNELFQNGPKSEEPELAEDVDDGQINEAEDLINSLLDSKIKTFAQKFIEKARELLTPPEGLMMFMQGLPEEVELENDGIEDQSDDTELIEALKLAEEAAEEAARALEAAEAEAEALRAAEDLVEASKLPEQLDDNETDETEEVEEVEEVEEIEEVEEEVEEEEEEEEEQQEETPDNDQLNDAVEQAEEALREAQQALEEAREVAQQANEALNGAQKALEEAKEKTEPEEIPQVLMRVQLLNDLDNLTLEDLLDEADLSGFEFELFEIIDGIEHSRGTIETDEDGKAVFPNMPEGNYVLRETNTKGYVSDIEDGEEFYYNVDTKAIVVTNTIDGDPDPEPEPKGRILIEKVDTNTGSLLAGARFEVRNMDGELVAVIETNSVGVGLSILLPYGEYTIQETRAPFGYRLNSEMHYISLQSEESYARIYNDRLPIPDPDPQPDPDPTPDPDPDPTPDPEPEPDPTPEPEPEPQPELPEDEEEIEEDPVPEAQPEPEPEPEVKDETVEVPEEEEEVVAEPVPQAKPVATLPKTGTASPLMTSGLGTLLLAAGLFLRKKRR